MFLNLFSWLLMLFCFLQLGLQWRLIEQKYFNYRDSNIFVTVLCGAVFAIVYSEIFSIFYRVNIEAFFLFMLVCFALFRKNLNYNIKIFNILRFFLGNELHTQYGFLLVTIILIGAYLSALCPTGYDTYNYHLPAIRWIEDYGSVLGLGNLHTRFAYNSSLFCLQALFSFSWVNGIKLHSVNGFFWVFFVIFSLEILRTIDKRLKICLSSLLTVLFLYLLLNEETVRGINTPNTDFLPSCIIAFVSVSWCKYYEERKNWCIYLPLCMLALCNVSIKLSSAALVILLFKPIVNGVKKKNYRFIKNSAIVVFVIIVPFIIRNLIISGYLVYPVTASAIYMLDWTIPKSVAITDNVMITVFARAWGYGYSYTDYIKPLYEWLPLWMTKATMYVNVILIFDLLLVILSLWLLIFKQSYIKYNNIDTWIMFTASLGFFFWMMTAPALRFGFWWFHFISVIYLYLFIRRIINRYDITGKSLMNFEWMSCICLVCLCYWVFPLQSNGDVANYVRNILVMPRQYDSAETKYAKENFKLINGIKFYYSNSNKHTDGLGLNGYAGFPGTETRETLEQIEFRGNDLQDGFRSKYSYDEAGYDFQGKELSNEIKIMLKID